MKYVFKIRNKKTGLFFKKGGGNGKRSWNTKGKIYGSMEDLRADWMIRLTCGKNFEDLEVVCYPVQEPTAEDLLVVMNKGDLNKDVDCRVKEIIDRHVEKAMKELVDGTRS